MRVPTTRESVESLPHASITEPRTPSVFANYMRDPERDGFAQPDIPQDVQAELLACASHKQIDFYWLCAVYRMALQAGLASVK